jgi:ribose/xylose/arabinose/galactoside ABC-type transport system permease subunit
MMIKHIFEILLVLMIIILGFTAPGFFSYRNIIGIFRNMALVGTLAYGITAAIICGEIDLSVPSTVALTGIVIGICCKAMPGREYIPVVVGVLIMLVVAICTGLLNTFLVLKFGMPAFIATMAVMYVLYGIAAIISGGFPVVGFPSWYSVIGAGNIMGVVPVPAVITLIMFFFTFIMMNHTKLGRSIYAVGGNIEAARLNGVNIKMVKALTFVFVQFCGVLSGVMVSSQVMAGGFNFAKGWDFQAISCVVIGGTAFTGGKGRIWGTFIGLFFYGIVSNAMTLLNVNQYAQYVVRGILILIAVIINSFHKG